MLFSGCCAVALQPAVWVWKRSCHERGLLRAVFFAHVARVDSACRPELGDLFEEVDMRVEEEREARRKRVDVHAGSHAGFDVSEAVGERERQLLRGRRARLANVVTGDRDRIPLRHLARAELDHVDDDAHVRTRREYPLLLRDVFFEDVGLDRSAQLGARNALFLGGRDILCERDAGRAVDRHRRGDLAHVDAVEEHFHVGQRIDRDAALADLAARLRARPSRSPSTSACRKPPKARVARARARSGSVRSSERRFQNRRTGASSRGGRDSRSGGSRACTDNRRATQSSRPSTSCGV